MEGLWTAEFGSSAGMFGGGVAVFQDGKILGGDGTYFYTGEYTLNGNAFQATLRISPFIAGAQSVFKTVGRDLELQLEGSLTDERHGTAQGSPKGMPQLRFGVKLTRRG
jgi:T3SS negative regulator,GrlR